MTWGSFASKSLIIIVIFPLVLKKFSTEEIALWFLFATIISLQSLIDLGFTPSFVRIISYAMGGIKKEDLKSPRGFYLHKPNFQLLTEINSTMKSIFSILSFFWLLILIVFGSLAVNKNINLLSNDYEGWFSWLIIVIVSVINFYSNSYSAFLQGLNQIALLRRWETLFNIISIIFSFTILTLDKGLLWLVAINQIMVFFSSIRNRALSRRIIKKLKIQNSLSKFKVDTEIFKAIWPSAWKSALGIIMSFGVTQFTGIYFAQVGNVEMVAQYLFALRIITFINQFSQAPFYSKIPFLSKLFAQNKIEDISTISKKSMNLSFLTFVLPFGLTLLFGKFFLNLINSNIDFPDITLWSLIGLAFLCERFGAMHIQIYSLSNNIIWHKANGISGLLNILLILLLYKKIGVYAFPISMFLSLVLFYCWYSAKHSYKLLKTKFFIFEKTSFIPNLILFIFFILINNYVHIN